MFFMENNNHSFRLYARAVIFDESCESVLLIKKHSSQKIGHGAWLLPGGTVEFGEDIEATLLREIQEETNLRIVNLKLITTKRMVIQDVYWLGIYYLGEVARVTDLKNLEESKHETVQFVPLVDVPDLRDYTILQFLKNIDSNMERFNVEIGSEKTHSMGQSLEQYVSIKMHHLMRINHECFSRVRVIGNHDRSVHVSRDEKTGKLFNSQRPTVFLDGDFYTYVAFPGMTMFVTTPTWRLLTLSLLENKNWFLIFTPVTPGWSVHLNRRICQTCLMRMSFFMETLNDWVFLKKKNSKDTAISFGRRVK